MENPGPANDVVQQLSREGEKWAAGGDAAPLVAAAANALAAGIDTRNLRILAGAPPATMEHEARELAPVVFEELGFEIHERLSKEAIESVNGAPPSQAEVRSWLSDLATGAISREDVSNIAQPWISDREREVDDDVVRRALISLCSADLPTAGRPYLYSSEDFVSWLAEFDRDAAETRS